MHLEVLSLSRMNSLPLMPSPNCTESAYISECLRANKRPIITDVASAGLIEILTDYRGYTLYCAGGITVYRRDPKTYSGHGRVSPPLHGLEENVYLLTSMGDFDARVKFVYPPSWYGSEPPTSETSGEEWIRRLNVIPGNPMMSQSDLERNAKDVGTDLLNEFLETNKWPSESWEGMVLRVKGLVRRV